jgi:hypothetical protein
MWKSFYLLEEYLKEDKRIIIYQSPKKIDRKLNLFRQSQQKPLCTWVHFEKPGGRPASPDGPLSH